MSQQTSDDGYPEINLREQLARIDNLLADTAKKQRQYHMAPWQVAATMVGAGAALMVVGAALTKLAG